ncbi:acyltransferase [Sphingomonas sp. SUN019]|uniref:acyltransferase family protein n=1 Tax=Sphingomonas sp. SUN019 TaxID=2937788 RepID=UPI00216467F8|nr:acyltransferase [Sphingomonas sp. SUN019]UVO49475.1 acyltransferase [Sphingomonas sp. SUN019]
MQRNSSIDAARGVAAVAVLLFHANYLSIGWIGVPIFFALSGYLITRQMRDGMRPITFWQRRAVRLIPPFYIYLVANLIIAEAQGRDMAGYPWHFLGGSDVLIAFGGASGHGHVGHLWSIAVEFQAYAVWPAIMAAGRFRRLILFAMAVGFFTVWAAVGHPAVMVGTAAFFALGALVALQGYEPPHIRVSRALVALGRASYSIYLWQMICVGGAMRLGYPIVGVAASIAVGLMSARWLEDWRWLLKLLNQSTRRRNRLKIISSGGVSIEVTT